MATPKCEEASIKTVVDGMNQFSANFFLKAAEVKGDDSNIVVSPLSASSATVMLSAGAKGLTHRTISEVLHYPDDNALENGFPKLLQSFERDTNESMGVICDVVNKIFVDKCRPLNDDYKEKMEEVYKSDVEIVDIRNNTEDERRKINDWVSTTTRHKINDMYPKGSLPAFTRMVLVNALYFKGKWEESFDPSKTKKRNFYVSRFNAVKVNMMSKGDGLYWCADIPELDAKGLELPYKGREVKMQIILPNKRDGTAELEKKLAEGFSLSSIQYHRTYLDEILLPKFKIEQTIDLNDVYSELGLEAIFTPAANFTGMAPGELWVDNARQKVFIEVNEEGTEAAAATSDDMCDGEVSVFCCNHPFIFRLVKDDIPILFGRISNPE